MANSMPGSSPSWDAAAAIKRFEGFLMRNAVNVAMYEDSTIYVLERRADKGFIIVFPWQLDEYPDAWALFSVTVEGQIHMIDTAVDHYLLGV